MIGNTADSYFAYAIFELYILLDMRYFSDDVNNGLWSDNPAAVKNNFLLAPSSYNEACSGCTCTADKLNVTNCNGPTV